MESYRGTSFHQLDIRQRAEGVQLSLTARTPDGVNMDVTVVGGNLATCKEEIRAIVDRYLDSEDREAIAQQLQIGRIVEDLSARSPELLDICLKATSRDRLTLQEAAERCLQLLDDGTPEALIQLQVCGEWGVVD